VSPLVLELRSFGVAYGRRSVLREIHASVPGTGCTVLLGPSGTGKSTLLRTLAGYNSANAELRTWGSVCYAGAPCADGHRPALVMQNSKLLVSDVLENLVCALPGRSELTRRMQIEALAPLLHECGQQGLLDCLHQKVVQRPIVEQRLVAILREAVAAPELLMLDEPTAGLLGQDASQVLELIATLSRRRALLVVLRNLQEAQRVADGIVLLAGGVVQEAAPASDFFTAPRSESGRLFLVTGSCPEPAMATGESTLAEAAPPPAPAAVPAVPAASAPSAACGPRGFVWLLPGQLAGTPWPGVVHGAAYDLQALQSVGVTRLVSLTEEPFDPALSQPYGIDCLSYPMPDMHPPTREQALAICGQIDRLLGAGEVVAVHCRAGLGRTGTVLAAYWLWRAAGALGAVRALEDVRRLEPGWVQSQAQVDFLEAFARMLAVGVHEQGPGRRRDLPGSVDCELEAEKTWT
jgi:atypical dual specificity phosphatase